MLQPHKDPPVPTPVNPARLQALLEGYDPDTTQFLCQGFSQGFHIPISNPPPPGLNVKPNHASISQFHAQAQAMIDKELAAGRIEGPFTAPPFEDFVVSPLAIRPKREEGKFRLIHDLSYPKGTSDSINANIPREECTVEYQLIDHVVSLLHQQGTGAYMAKADIQEAFRIVPISPLSYHLLGFKFNDCFYYDKCLPMGLSISCSLFEKLSCALVWIAQNKFGASSISHILDDFIFISISPSICAKSLTSFIDMCASLGVPIKHGKTVPPAQVIEAHGLLLDSIQKQIRLPADKLQDCQAQLSLFSQKTKCTLKQLQSLIGTLQFASKAIKPGRPFLRRLINLTCGVTQSFHRIRLNGESRADINCWFNFLQAHNGTTLFLEQDWLSSDSINLYTDAAGSKGYAAVYGHYWVAGPFPDSWDDYHITVKELYPIVLALSIWGHTLTNRRLRFHTDNQACVHIINSQTSKDNLIMRLVRCLVTTSLKHNILFRAEHVPGRHNLIPDLLSRFQFQKARQVAPWLNSAPTAIPEPLTPQRMIS